MQHRKMHEKSQPFHARNSLILDCKTDEHLNGCQFLLLVYSKLKDLLKSSNVACETDFIFLAFFRDECCLLVHGHVFNCTVNVDSIGLRTSRDGHVRYQ